MSSTRTVVDLEESLWLAARHAVVDRRLRSLSRLVNVAVAAFLGVPAPPERKPGRKAKPASPPKRARRSR